MAIFGEVAYFSTIEAWSFQAWSLIVGFPLDVCGIVVLWLSGVRVGIVALILASVVGDSSSQQVHWYLDVVICRSWCIGGIVLWSLLLLLLLRPLLVLLGLSSPGLWSELRLILPKCVVKPSLVGDSSSGPDEFDHQSSFGDVDHPGLVFVVGLWNWEFDDFI
jgi:hypothetical protein